MKCIITVENSNTLISGGIKIKARMTQIVDIGSIIIICFGLYVAFYIYLSQLFIYYIEKECVM